MRDATVAGGTATLQPRGVGELLGAAFGLYRRYWRTLLAIAAIVVVPLTLLQHLLGDGLRSSAEVTRNGVVVSTSVWAASTASLLAALVATLGQLVLTGAMTRAVAGEAAGETADVRESYRFGLARLGPILLVSLLVGLATLAGFVVLVLPGIYIGVRLAVAVEALVVEGRRGRRAVARSWSLAKGHWWHAFGTLVVASLLSGVASVVLTVPFADAGWVARGLADAVARLLTLPYVALVGILLYLDLRTRREGLSLDALRADLRASSA
jgi:hypothetical protein